MKRKAIIIDIDGTMADSEPRRQRASATGKMNWKLWNDEMGGDKPNAWCVELVNYFNSYGYEIVFVTGRHAEHEGVTTTWLVAHSQVKRWHLYMRPDGDYRTDDVVKEELYRKHIEPFFDVLFCVDDRKRVVDMWRKLGLTCLQCAEGNF